MKYIFFIVFAFPPFALAQTHSSTDTADLRTAPHTSSNSKPESAKDETGPNDEVATLQNMDDIIEYPEEAKKAGIEGKVTFSVLVDEAGAVRKVDFDTTAKDVFRQPIIEGLNKVHFSPSRKNGKPTMIWYVKSILFKLDPPDVEKPHQY